MLLLALAAPGAECTPLVRARRALSQVGADGPVPELKGVYDGVLATTPAPGVFLAPGEVKELACGYPAAGGEKGGRWPAEYRILTERRGHSAALGSGSNVDSK
jgi:hypothetical protein